MCQFSRRNHIFFLMSIPKEHVQHRYVVNVPFAGVERGDLRAVCVRVHLLQPVIHPIVLDRRNSAIITVRLWFTKRVWRFWLFLYFFDACTNRSMTFHLHKESNKINIRRGVRQGDTILPNLFIAALKSIFRRLPWEPSGLKIDGEYLSHLRFADDILICANKPYELQQMLHEFSDESDNQGLKMNNSKTMVMMETGTPL